MRTLAALIALLVGPTAAPSWGAEQPPASDVTDYAQGSHWVCRPGSESICTAGLDALTVYADGHRDAQPFSPAADPAIDCFYVYPTVSREQAPYSDLVASPEIQTVVNAQAGRLTSRCRVFAPLYRQATLWHLRRSLSGESVVKSDVPAQDVRAAWAYYLEHDNHGRGVVLIGHSQGTILLQALIAEHIDGAPSQRLLVSAFLAGDPSLSVPKGARVGDTFKHIPTCSALSQTGCVYVWGSYLADDDATPRSFGEMRQDGRESACVSPAAPAGGSGTLKFYHTKRDTASTDDPPWVETVGQVAGACQPDAQGNVFRVSTKPGPLEAELAALLKSSQGRPGWGLHARDIALVQGNILDVLDAEAAAWKVRGDRRR